MTLGETFDKAIRLAMKGDFVLYDELLHSDYESINQRVPINKEMSKAILSGVGEFTLVGPMAIIYENDEFACIHQITKILKSEIFNSVMIAINFKDGKVIRQQTVWHELNEDPSDGEDWNWEDYE